MEEVTKKNIWKETSKTKMDGTEDIPRTNRNTSKLVYDDAFLHDNNTGHGTQDNKRKGNLLSSQKRSPLAISPFIEGGTSSTPVKNHTHSYLTTDNSYSNTSYNFNRYPLTLSQLG